MSQVEVPKSVMTTLIGSDSDEAAAVKVVMTAILVPSDADDDTFRAVTVNTRIIRRS